MTDLSKGIIELDKFTITRGTKRSELVAAFQDKLASFSNAKLVKFLRSFVVSGQEFSCFFFFDENERIKSVQLTPYVDYRSEEWDRAGQQEERRQVCDKWLFDQLGAPHKVINGDIDYHYEGVYIGSFSDFDIRNDYNGGKITIAFEN